MFGKKVLINKCFGRFRINNEKISLFLVNGVFILLTLWFWIESGAIKDLFENVIGFIIGSAVIFGISYAIYMPYFLFFKNFFKFVSKFFIIPVIKLLCFIPDYILYKGYTKLYKKIMFLEKTNIKKIHKPIQITSFKEFREILDNMDIKVVVYEYN